MTPPSKKKSNHRRRVAGRSRRHGAPTPRPSAEAIVVVGVERLAAGGDGIAHLVDGRTLFVEGGVPGDTVRVQIERFGKRWARGRVIEVEKAGPNRVVERCRHFGECGGCAWQHVSYPAQVSAKAEILRDALVRIGGLELVGAPMVSESPQPYAYRGRARVLVEAGRVGYRARATDRLCAVDECPILVPTLEDALTTLRNDLRAETTEPGRTEWSLCAGSSGEVDATRSQQADAHGETSQGLRAPVFLDVAGERVEISADSFSQANRLLDGRLVERLLHQVMIGTDSEDRPSAHVIEVHAGVGFFTLALARRVASIVAVEPNAVATQLLNKNLDSAGLTNVDVFVGTLEQAVDSLHGRTADVIVLDPPRAGLSEKERAFVAENGARRIVYLSCDPATLARDLRVLVDSGYCLAHVEGFDLFPQTPHVEALVRLEKQG